MGKSYILLSSAAILFAAGQATAGALNAPNEIFIGGATAVQETFHLDILLRFCNYDGNVDDTDGVITPSIYVDSIITTPGGGNGTATTPALNHRNQQVIHCNFKNSLPGALAGSEVAVYKYNGGSGTGVAPVADPNTAPAADKRYMNASPAACTPVVPTSNNVAANTFLSIDGATRFKLYTCPSSTVVTQDPDGGISDVEPKIFVGQLATGFGNSVPGITPDKPQNDFVDKGNLIVKAGPGLIFGVNATLPLYDELAEDQQAAGLLPGCEQAFLPSTPGDPNATPPVPAFRDSRRDTVACMPSLPTPMIQSLFSGELPSWSTRSVYGQLLNGTGKVQQGNKVNICRRTAGSGTHAQFMVNFFRTNCANATTSMVTFANNVPAPVQAPQVYENEGSGNLDLCLDALGRGTGYNGGWTDGFTAFPGAPSQGGGNSSVIPVGRSAYGIGYNSTERNASLARAFRFVKVDGLAPTLENAFNGNYTDIYYVSYQNRVDANGNPEPRTGAIRTVAVDAAEIQVQKEFFNLWNSPNAASVDAVNDGLIVNPDKTANNGDEWQGGFLVGSRSAPQVFSAGPNPANNDPRAPWSRETAAGGADSCQELSYKNP